jgi:hypothetical protein
LSERDNTIDIVTKTVIVVRFLFQLDRHAVCMAQMENRQSFNQGNLMTGDNWWELSIKLDITGVEWRVKTRINWLGVAYSNGLL